MGRARLAALLLAVGCADGAPPPNLLLVTIDTLRADRLGCYGYGRDVSPEIDALAADGFVFEQAQSTSSWTLPGLASVMTSVYTSTHGCARDHDGLAEDFTTLAERLATAGWRTGAVVSHVYLDPRYGLHQGFEDYDDELVFAREESHRTITSEEIADRGLAWIDAGDEPFFLWLHFFDPHHLYLPHGDDEAAGERELYDGEIAYTSRHVGRVLDGLAARGLDDRTVVALVADHGEEFGEHGGRFHRRTLHDEVLRVPLIVRAPGIPPGRADDVVSVVDLAPTLLELLGLRAPADVAGRSLAPLLRGEPLPPRPALAELETHAFAYRAIVDERWKLVARLDEPGVALYDRRADPGETRDVAGEHPEVVAALTAALLEEVAEAAAAARDPDAVELGAELRERLAQLGYLDDVTR